MNIKKPWLLRLLLSLSLLSSLTSCESIQIQDSHECSENGKLSNGMICTHLIGSASNLLTFNETIDFLSAQPARSCVTVPGMPVCQDDQTIGTPTALPARGAAFCRSSDDEAMIDKEVATLCRLMGKNCSYVIQAYLMKKGLL